MTSLKILFLLYFIFLPFLVIVGSDDLSTRLLAFVWIIFVILSIIGWKMYRQKIGLSQFVSNTTESALRKLHEILDIIKNITFENAWDWISTSINGIIGIALGLLLIGGVLFSGYYIVGGVVGLLNFGWKNI